MQYSPQYFSPPGCVFETTGTSDTGSRPQWQESGFVSGPGNYMTHQVGGGGQPMRMNPTPQQGPPQSQPTPTSTPPGDMKASSHLPGQQGNLDLGGIMYSQRPPPTNQSYHASYPSPSRLQGPRMPRNPQTLNNVPSVYPVTGHFSVMPPTMMINVAPQLHQYQYQNQRQGQNSSAPFFTQTAPIIMPGPNPQFYSTASYFSSIPPRPQFLQPNQGTGPVNAAGAPQGPVPAMTNVQGGMIPGPPQMPTVENKKNRKHAIPIINPDTGVDIFSEPDSTGNNNNDTPVRSNDSSARETPQPEPDKTIAVEFAAKVALAATSPDVNGPQVIDIPSESDSVHKQPVPSSDIKVTHQLQTNAVNFVPKSQMQQQPPPSLPLHISEPLPPVQPIEERQSNNTPIVSAVTNSPAVEIHRGDRQHKETPVSKPVQPIITGSIAQSPNRAPVRKQKTSESERQPVQPVETPVVVPAETVQPVKKGQKHKDETVTAQPKERREKSRSVSKEQTPPISVEIPQVSAPTTKPSQFHSMTNIKDFTSSNIIPASVSAEESNKQQANGETHVPEIIDAGNKSSQKAKKKGCKMKGELNRKGVEKEGTDMDAFTEQAITVAEEKEHVSSSPASPTPPAQPSPTPENKIKDDMEEREEKIVAAKNEENAKVSVLNVDEVIEKSAPQICLKFKYKDDQWSPINPEGKRKYERDFLMELKNEPQSRKKPENFPDWEAILKDTSNRQHRGGGMQNNMFNMRHDMMMMTPVFFNKSSNSQRGLVTKRNSQQGAGKKGGKPNVIHVSLSLHEDVKLRESENAWKPKVRTYNNVENLSNEQRDSEELYKKVRGILNKLTPQKFDKLMSQVKSLPINTVERLERVIDLVFEKAVDEPGFSKAYANMCKLLSDMEIISQNEEGKDIKVNFRKLIITRCQSEFESEKHAELDVEKRLEEIKNCADPEKKKELQLVFEEDERRVRMKSVGNIRFIGELFKLQMLTPTIMFRCLQHMLKKPEEESLECLCKLLTTIGKDLEMCKDAAQLHPIFQQMNSLSQKQENSKISSRVRFMLQDVIDLRKNRWIPRRDDNNPKTIDQITKDAERESLEMTLALNAPRPKTYDSHPDDRRGGRGRNMNQSEDGWTSVSTGKGGYRNTNTFDQTKMIGLRRDIDSHELSLGPSTQFRSYAFVNNSKNAEKSHIATNNMYSALRNDDRKPPPSNMSMNKPPPRMTPSTSIEKDRSSYKDSYDGRLSRGSSLQRDRQIQSPQPQSRDNSVPRQLQPTTPVPSNRLQETLSLDDIKRLSESLLQEYISVKDINDAKLNVEEKFSPRYVIDFLQNAFEFGLEHKSEPRVFVGNLITELLKTSVITTDDLVKALSFLIESGEDISIDIPKFWEYLAEMIVPIICAEKLSLADVHKAATSVLNSPSIGQLLISIFNMIVKNLGPEFAHKSLATSKLSLGDFLPSESVDTFIKENKLEFLNGGVYSANSSLPMNQIEDKLKQLFKNHTSVDTIQHWITANVKAEQIKDTLFCRTLVTAICETCTKSAQAGRGLDEKLFKEYEKLITMCIDTNENLELSALNAIQALVTKLEYPSGLLVALFNTLWEDGLISNESFLKWRNSGEEAGGKGVAIKSLVSFFVALEDAESEDETS